MARKLPIGIQSFEGLRKDGYLYVDKTALIYKLVSEGKPYFLSRPRQFGKSLLVSTLRAYFEGKRELFDGLAIQQLEGDGSDAWQPRPVFLFSFNGTDYTREGALDAKLEEMLDELEETWGCAHVGLQPGPRLQRLLRLVHKQTGHRCVVLVDEYDAPMLDVIHDLALEERNRAALKAFFSVLKSADEHLRFVFITGVTKFSKVSIFSDLNHLNDISMNRSFASVPYTQADDPFENYFQAIIWLVFTLLGRYVRVEIHQARGRVDCVVQARSHVYLFEFKRDGTAREALAQIDEQGYAEPFVADSRTLHLIGCSFDSATRLMAEWEER